MSGNNFDSSGFKDYRPFPAARERGQWESLPDALKAEILSLGRKRLGFIYPQITATDWLRYGRTGDREVFETKYFERRRALCALILAECVENRGEFMDGILDGIVAILEESGWQLPAHNTYVRDTPALPMPDTRRPLLDLFACETGALLAAATYLLGEKLDMIQERVILELDDRIKRPYLDGWFWWMGGNMEPTNNWTVWCTQNILFTFFLTETSTELRRAAVKKAARSVEAFLSGYGDDGCCDEGAQYYRHAGLCLFNALETLEAVTDGITDGYYAGGGFNCAKIRNIARYILDVHVDGKYYVNFSDCSPVAGRAGVREYLFGKRCGDNELCAFAAAEWSEDADRLKKDEINLFYRAQSVFAYREMSTAGAEVKHREVYYPSTGLFIARDEVFCLAVKAGCNGDSHNHNDTGSFTLYKRGKPFFIDIGVENYTKKTFSQDRYEIWTMRSSWHNLPDFDGQEEAPGVDCRATDVTVSFGETVSKIAMRLDSAWGAQNKPEYFNRTCRLEKGRQVIISDECRGGYKQAVLNLIMCEEPATSREYPAERVRVCAGGLGEFTLVGATDIAAELVTITDSKLKIAWGDKIWRLRISFGDRLTIAVPV